LEEDILLTIFISVFELKTTAFQAPVLHSYFNVPDALSFKRKFFIKELFISCIPLAIYK